MQKSEERLIAGWARVEYSDINAVNDCGIDDLPENAQTDDESLIERKKKKVRHNDIPATLTFLSGGEIDVETNTVFGKRTEKEFVMQPFRSVEEHEKRVQAMADRGYAFDRMAGGKWQNDGILDRGDKFTPRELAPVAQAIFGIINESENTRQIHKRER